MRVTISTVLILVAASMYGNDLPVRIEYDQESAPNGVIFRSMVRTHIGPSDNLSESERIEILRSEMDIYRLPNGSWTFPREPKYSQEQAIALLEYLRKIDQEAEHRWKEIWRVLACPGDRTRPSGDDVWLVLEVHQDAQDPLWEQLRQKAVVEYGPLIAEMTDKHRQRIGMSSRRYHMKEMSALSGREDSETLLNELCVSSGL